MLQLRELDIGRTSATGVSALSALQNLESLATTFSRAADLSFVQELVELRVLKVGSWHPCGIKGHLPPLLTPPRLRSLEISSCVVDSSDSFLRLLSRLNHLRLHAVEVRRCEDWHSSMTAGELVDEELAHTLAQLRVLSGDHHASGTIILSGTLSRFSRLEVTACSVDERGSYNLLEGLDYLEELALSLPGQGDFEPRDFRVLLKLPRLTSLDLYRSLRMNCDRQEQELCDVLVQLTKLKHLSIRGAINITERSLAALTANVEHLDLRIESKPTPFDWTNYTLTEYK